MRHAWIALPRWAAPVIALATLSGCAPGPPFAVPATPDGQAYFMRFPHGERVETEHGRALIFGLENVTPPRRP